eukprot:710023_1
MPVDNYIKQTSFATVPVSDSESGSRDSTCTNVRTSSENLHRKFEIARKQRAKLCEPFRTGAWGSLKPSKMELCSHSASKPTTPIDVSFTEHPESTDQGHVLPRSFVLFGRKFALDVCACALFTDGYVADADRNRVHRVTDLHEDLHEES